MSEDQKQTEISPKEESIKEILSKRFSKKAYWTFKEGINYFLPEEYRNSFPLQVIINDSLFDTIKRDIETNDQTKIQRLETFNSGEEIEQILNYDPVEDFENFKSNRPEKRKVELQFRKWKRSNSIDIDGKLGFYEIKEDKLKYFCSHVKIKPEILIIYIIDHIDQFSSEIVIPPKLENLLSTCQKNAPLEKNKNIGQISSKTTKAEIEQLLKDVYPELENLFETTKKNLKQNGLKVKKATAEQICDACYEAYQNIIDSKEIVDSIKFFEKDDIDCNYITNNTEHLPRELKGPILYNLVFRKYKKIPKSIGIPTNSQHLYDLYNSLNKETKK